MSDVRQIAAAPAQSVPAVPRLFISRLAVSLLMTGVDAGIVVIYALSALSDSFSPLILRASFAVLVLGMAASLAHMWTLTFRALTDQPSAG